MPVTLRPRGRDRQVPARAGDGDPVPLTLLFSGTVFGKGDTGFWVEQVPWHAEATYRLPPSVWRDVMDQYFPDSGWLRLRRETLDDADALQGRRGASRPGTTIRSIDAGPAERRGDRR